MHRLVILLYTIIFNKRMYSKVKGKFLSILLLVVLESIFAALETYYGGLFRFNGSKFMIITSFSYMP